MTFPANRRALTKSRPEDCVDFLLRVYASSHPSRLYRLVCTAQRSTNVDAEQQTHLESLWRWPTGDDCIWEPRPTDVHFGTIERLRDLFSGVSLPGWTRWCRQSELFAAPVRWPGCVQLTRPYADTGYVHGTGGYR